jgi:hypothetical protein
MKKGISENCSYNAGDQFYYLAGGSIEPSVEVATIFESRGRLYAMVTYSYGTEEETTNVTNFELNGVVFSRFKNNRLTPLMRELL